MSYVCSIFVESYIFAATMLQNIIENSPLLQIATSLLQIIRLCYIHFRTENQAFTKLLHVATNVTYMFSLLKSIFKGR